MQLPCFPCAPSTVREMLFSRSGCSPTTDSGIRKPPETPSISAKVAALERTRSKLLAPARFLRQVAISCSVDRKRQWRGDSSSRRRGIDGYVCRACGRNAAFRYHCGQGLAADKLGGKIHSIPLNLGSGHEVRTGGRKGECGPAVGRRTR